MNEKNYFYFVAALLVACFVIVGAIGGDCVKDCKEKGNSESACFNLCRP